VFGKLGNAGLAFGAGIVNAIKGIGSSIKSIGAELAVFAVLATLTAAYSKATEIARQKQEESRASIEKLQGTVADLKSRLEEFGKVDDPFADFNKEISATDAVLIGLGGAIKKVVNFFKEFIAKIAGFKADPVTKELKKMEDASTSFNSAIALMLGAGALGFFLTGGSPIGAAIGLIGGAIAAIAIKAAVASASIEQIRQSFEGSRETYSKQGAELIKIAELLGKYKKQIDALNATRVEPKGAGGGKPVADPNATRAQLTGKAAAGLSTLTQGYENFNDELKTTQAELLAVQTRLNNTAKYINNLVAAQRNAPTNFFGQTKDKGAYEQRRQQIEKLRKQYEKDKVIQEELKKSELELQQQKAALEAQINRLKAAFPGLTDEIINSENTSSKLSAKYKQLKDDLELIDPQKLPGAFDALAESMGRTKAELEAIEDRAKSGELKGYIERFKQQLAGKEIPFSLKNIGKLVSALEERSIDLDINSPELPGVITELQLARQKAEELNSIKAEIEIKVTTEALKSGQLQSTQAVLGRLIASYEQLANTAVIGSKQFEQVKTFKAGLQDLAAFVAKTKLQIDEENRNLQKTIRDNEIKLNIAPGPLRDALAVANQANTDVVNAANKYAQIIRDTEEQKKAGIINQDTANERLKQAGYEYKAAITSAAAAIRDTIRSLKETIESSTNSIRNLKLSKPQFFTRDELRANAEEIRAEFNRYLEENNLTVTITGTYDEQTAIMQDFLETRKQADKLERTIVEARQAIAALEAAFQKLVEGAGGLAKIDLAVPVANAESLGNSLAYGALKAQEISDVLDNIPREITINVKYTGNSPRFSGGPVSAGQAYTVNELGQEGFLSNSGKITAINKPRNSTWRPASSGTVIPAHIWKQMKSSGAASVSMPRGNYSRQNGMDLMVSAFGSFMSAHSAVTSRSNNENARVQAHQASQIEKLSRAINKLADKNWNVDVKVRNTGNTAYLDAINRVL
jgi:hypothetical protein